MNRLFIWMANGLGVNIFILLLFVIAFAPLAYQRPQTLLDWQQWISQTVIQLVALGLLAKLAKIEGEKQGKLIQETHDVAMDSHDELHSKLDLIIEKLGDDSGK